jgi:hypothetical protein
VWRWRAPGPAAHKQAQCEATVACAVKNAEAPVVAWQPGGGGSVLAGVGGAVCSGLALWTAPVELQAKRLTDEEARARHIEQTRTMGTRAAEERMAEAAAHASRVAEAEAAAAAQAKVAAQRALRLRQRAEAKATEAEALKEKAVQLRAKAEVAAAEAEEGTERATQLRLRADTTAAKAEEEVGNAMHMRLRAEEAEAAQAQAQADLELEAREAAARAEREKAELLTEEDMTFDALRDSSLLKDQLVYLMRKREATRRRQAEAATAAEQEEAAAEAAEAAEEAAAASRAAQLAEGQVLKDQMIELVRGNTPDAPSSPEGRTLVLTEENLLRLIQQLAAAPTTPPTPPSNALVERKPEAEAEEEAEPVQVLRPLAADEPWGDEPSLRLQGHSSSVNAVAWSADGVVATASADATVRVRTPTYPGWVNET